KRVCTWCRRSSTNPVGGPSRAEAVARERQRRRRGFRTINMHTKTLTALSRSLRRREFSAEELARHCLDRVARHDSQLNCFITVTEQLALEQARAARRGIAGGAGGGARG